MDFIVDKVSEHSFFMNLLTGMPKQLDKLKKYGITMRHLTRKLPVPHSEICVWEQKQNILLPEDLRNFYNSCNGFLFIWKYQFGNSTKEVTGRIQVNGLENLIQLAGYDSKHDPGVITNINRFELQLGAASKVFELVPLDNDCKVVLVYLNSRFSPTIWVTTGPNNFYFLANDFATYFRMSLAHIGVPHWQMLFTPQGVPQWTENMIRLLAPNLLVSNRTIESARKQRESKILDEHFDIPVNFLQVNIFKCLPRMQHNPPRVIEKEKVVKKEKRERNDAEKHLVVTKEKALLKPTHRKK